MFTVIIAEKEHIEALQQKNKLFFEPFLENKELAFCYWNVAGQNLSDSAPGLLDTVGRKKKWRAVIINNATEDSLKARNPFDTVESSAADLLTAPNSQPDPDESWEDWETSWRTYYASLLEERERIFQKALEYPLQKLATWLCFFPQDYILDDVQEKQDVRDWAMKEIGRDEGKYSARLEAMENLYYRNELRLKENIRRAFWGENYLNISYPAEVHCITCRTMEKSTFHPDAYWNVRQDSEYSDFAGRNMFFDKMRFLVFDLLPCTHRDFRVDYIRFLASVLIFSSNPIPGSAMHARRLYQLETETDDTPLCTLVTSYDKKLEATFDVIENEIERISGEIPVKLTDKDAEMLFCTPAEVEVLFDDSCDPEKVLVDQDYGLFFDSPENEHHKWNRGYQTSEKELSYLAKQQTRSIRKSVGKMHLSSEISDVNIKRLTSLQVDDIREFTDNAENEMVASLPPNLADVSRYTKRISEKADAVKKIISRRMTKKTTLTLSAICFGLYLICFMPFVFSNNSTAKSVATAVALCGAMLGLLTVIMLVSLLLLRSSVLDAVREYNSTVNDILKEIQSSMKRFSKYLSASCNVRRGHAIQNHADKNLDEYTKSLRIRKKHQEDIRRKRAYLAEDYRDFFGDRSFCDETMSRPYDYDFGQKMEYLYPAPFLAGDCRQIEFISNGNYVTVPSSYVTRMLVRMEGIYEK